MGRRWSNLITIKMKTTMKRSLYFAAALAIVGAVSCNKELVDNSTPEVPEAKLATLTATIGEPGTKTSLATPENAHVDGSKTFWCAADAISVFDGKSNMEYTIKDSESYLAAEEAVFEGEELDAEAAEFFALYPYTETAEVADGVVKGAVLPAEQTAVEGNLPEGAALAVAYSTDKSALYFKNVATTIGFTLTEAATKVEFVAKGGESIAGTIDITYDGENAPTYTVQEEKGNNTVTLNNLEAGTYFFTILPDVTLSQGYELKIDGYTAKTGAVGMKLERSKVYSLGEVTYVVPAWTVAGTFNGWNTASDPMTLENGIYVYRNISGLNFTEQQDVEDKSSSTGFKFIQDGTAWRGGYGDTDTPGKLSVNSWSYYWDDNGMNIYVDGASAENEYDVYLNPESKKFVIVEAGEDMPEDVVVEEEVVVDYWAVIGTMTDNWASEVEMTLDGDWHIAEGVKITTSDQFKFRANGDADWTLNRGAEGQVDGVVIADNEETSVVQSGKNFSVASDGVYSIYINKYANKVKVVRTGDIVVEEPDVTVPGEDSEWAVYAQFGSENWTEVMMKTTTREGLFVVENKTMDAYNKLLIKKYNDASWSIKYGSDNVNYIKANKYFSVVSSGSDIYVEADCTYDIYFDYTNKEVYLMAAGENYASASEQTVSGTEPVISDGKTIYLKSGVWGDAVFTAWVWGDGEQWVTFEKTGESGVYSAVVPAGTTTMIFLRKSSDHSLTSWDCWNRTGDETIGTNNCFTVTAYNGGNGNNDYSKGTWSVK